MQAYQRISTATIGHVVDGHAMNPGLSMLAGSGLAAGPALTLQTAGRGSTVCHKALDLIEPGDVIVVDRGGDGRYACWAEMMSFAARLKGAAAVIVDGAVTDITALRSMGLPVFARSRSPLATELLGEGGSINAVASCGGLTVTPGALVLADDDGILMLDGNEAGQVLALAEEESQSDEKFKAQLLLGRPLVGAVAHRQPDERSQSCPVTRWRQPCPRASTPTERGRTSTRFPATGSRCSPRAPSRYTGHTCRSARTFSSQRLSAGSWRASRLGPMCLLVVPLGYSADLPSFPGTLYVPPEAFKAYVSVICHSLTTWGFCKILFLNTHLGNVRILDQLSDELTAAGEARCLQIDWRRFADPLGAVLWDSGGWSAGHAGELGTSVLLHLRPEFVRRSGRTTSSPLIRCCPPEPRITGPSGRSPQALCWDSPPLLPPRRAQKLLSAPWTLSPTWPARACRGAMMRVAAVQMCSGADPAANLESADRLVGRAARLGAEYVLLPECLSYLGPPSGNAAAAQDIPGPATRRLAQLAAAHGIYLHIGSMLERSGVDGKSYNTSVLLDPAGAIAAAYRKVHLFDIEVPGEVSERESDTIASGQQLVVAALPQATLGLSICFDLRFPEMYRALALAGADVFALPAAFAVPTGRVHWEILVRARAIENHAYVIAAGQAGTTPDGVASYGHSLIVGPWGEVLAAAQTDGEEVLVTDIDAAQAAARRAQIPVDAMRRPDIYATASPGGPDAS